MGIYTTQFEMKNVLTHVTVDELGNDTFGCLLYMENISAAADLQMVALDYDIVIRRIGPGKWETLGEPKTSLSEEEILSLGNAIEGDKTVELFGSEY